MKKYAFLILPILILFINCLPGNSLFAQIKGETPPKFNPDTVFVFNSPRPLVDDRMITNTFKNGYGLDVLFSNNGFGFGLFFQHYFTKNFAGFASLYMSGARNTDEFESWDYDNERWIILNKVNRVYMFPLTLGVQRYVFTEELTESLRPYFALGFGPAFIISTPYEREFFNSFGYTTSYTRFSAFGGIGVSLGGIGKSIMDVYCRFYYIPFGGNGLESIRNLPMKDFGGIFLSLSIGGRY